MINTTLLLTNVWGSFLLISALLFLAIPSIKDSYIKLFKPTKMRLLTAFLTRTLGITSIFNHNIWKPDIQGLITLFGWMALMKGILIAIFPPVLNESEQIAKSKWFTYYLIIMICLGFYLLSFSFETIFRS